MDDLETYFDAVFADATGIAHFALGRGLTVTDGKYKWASFRPMTFLWPQEKAEALKFVRQSSRRGDVFVCPNLMKGRERGKGQSVARWTVHADVDKTPCSGQLIKDVASLDGFIVASGSDNSFHVYIRMDRSLTLEEHRALCVALRDRLRGDNKISDNDLLRPPEARNYKRKARGQQPTEVRFVTRPPDHAVAPEELAGRLGISLPSAVRDDDAPPRLASPMGQSRDFLSATSDIAPQVRVWDALGEITGDRSRDTMCIVGAGYDEGLSIDEIRALIQKHRPGLHERLEEREDDDLQRCWDKVDLDRRARRGATDATTEPEHRAVITPGRQPIERVEIGLLLADEYPEREWVVQDFIPAGASVSIVAAAGVGKSLLVLAVSLAIARGETNFAGLAIPRRRKVVYIDMENTLQDLRERLLALGVTSQVVAQLDGLFLLHLPDLADLDKATGAAHLMAALAELGVEPGDLVVLDSFQRVTVGPENEADTMRQYYAHTGVQLKRRGLTVLRTDNSGKDPSKGARGSAGKRDDVDIEYQLTSTRTELTLTVKKARMPLDQQIRIGRDHDQGSGELFYFAPEVDTAADAIADLVEVMDELEMPAYGADRARTWLAERQQHPSRKVLREALRQRKQTSPDPAAPDAGG